MKGFLLLTLDAIQVSGGQCQSFALIRGDALVLGLLSARHVACAPALLQVVAATGHPGQLWLFGRRRRGNRTGSAG